MSKEVQPTKILIIDSDEASFQFCRCMAKVLSELPPLEFYHAHDATEALACMDEVKPDVVVLADDSEDERDLLLDNLSTNHPPVIVQTDEEGFNEGNRWSNISQVPRGETLEGIHRTLVLASSLATGISPTPSTSNIH